MIWTRHFDAHVCKDGAYEIEITPTYMLSPTRIPKSEKYVLDIHGPWCLYRCFPTIKAAKAAAERVIAALKEDE